jgi:dipeptidyl aminopeptidase/acylaminoacyl peptidase
VTDETRAILRQITPINHVKPGLPPVLLLQGSLDKTVQPEPSMNFHRKMKAAGVPCDLVMIEGGAHRFTEWEKFDPGFTKKIADWLAATLNAQSKPAVSPTTRGAE